MAEEFFTIEPTRDGDDEELRTIVLRVHVRPGAGRSAIVGRYGDALHVRVAPPPVQDRANVAVVELVADTLGVTAGSVELISGATSRDKRVRVERVNTDDVRQRLDQALLDASTNPGGGRGRPTR